MPTIQDAIREGGNWTITGKLANKYIFVKKQVLLVLVLIDEDGETIDIQCWKPKDPEESKKCYCVYRKVQIDCSYVVTGKAPIVKPDPKFSSSDWKTPNFKRIYSIEDVKARKHLRCLTNLSSAIRVLNDKVTVPNLLGTFVKLEVEPSAACYLPNGKPYIQGYNAEMRDDSGSTFRVLVWQSRRVQGNKFSLFNCRQGDNVLFYSLRPGRIPPNAEKRHYTLTTLFEPVVNSELISPRSKQDLNNSGRTTNTHFIGYVSQAIAVE